MGFQRGEAVAVPESENLYQFSMQGTGYAAAALDVGRAIRQISGKPVDEAARLLDEALPLKKLPEISVYPRWFPALPWLLFRIQAEVDPQG
jgi:hypothetical protein